MRLLKEFQPSPVLPHSRLDLEERIILSLPVLERWARDRDDPDLRGCFSA